jgi:2-polyprenyl-6-methoxyphenol hydroxylase-like FAD-dependent oxidoreductase
MQKTIQDVLVVGAGPVGLTMAAELARHGASCRIIDQLAVPLPYCRVTGVTPRTLEVWDDMGIVQPMIDAGLWLGGTRSIINGSQIPDSLRDLSDLPYGQLGIRQSETERILAAHLAGFGGAIERQLTLSGFRQNEESVEVELLHANQSTEKAAFRYVVGCDGARSMVRRQLGIAFEGDQFPVGFILGDVMIDLDLPRGMILRSINPRAGQAPDFFLAIPLPERNRYRITTLAPTTNENSTEVIEHGLQTDRVAPTLDELQAVADRLLLTKVTLSDMQWSSNFRISMRLAARYREGRGFLAGDAAHIHPPTGGQGMNTGIQDAYNLAWKMALVLKGNASPKLLDTYEAERRPVGADVVARTRTASEQLGRKEASQQERLADTQILLNYRGSTLSKDAVREPLEGLPVHAGDRAPDCLGLRRENVRSPFRLFDLTRGIDHVLLFYVGQSFEPSQIELLERMAQTLKTATGPKCRLVAICAPDAKISDIVNVPVVMDTAGEFAAAYAPGSGTGFVVRPDGYVGYHARPTSEKGLLEYLAGPV